MDFQEKLYIIQAGVPATMVRNPTTLYQFMAPINPSISKLRISWYSSPQVSLPWVDVLQIPVQVNQRAQAVISCDLQRNFLPSMILMMC